MNTDKNDSRTPVPFYYNMMVELFKTEIKFLEDMTALKKYLEHLTDKSKIDPKVIEPIKREIDFIIKAIDDYKATSFAVSVVDVDADADADADAVKMDSRYIEKELKNPEFLSSINFEKSAASAYAIIDIALNCSYILNKTASNKELANALEKEFQQCNQGSTNGRTFNSEVIKSVQRTMRFTMPFDEAYKAMQKQDVVAMQKQNENYGRVEFTIFKSKFDQLFKSSAVSDHKLDKIKQVAEELRSISEIPGNQSEDVSLLGKVKSFFGKTDYKPKTSAFDQRRHSIGAAMSKMSPSSSAATKKQEHPKSSSTSAKILHSRSSEVSEVSEVSENSSKSINPLSTLKKKLFGKN